MLRLATLAGIHNECTTESGSPPRTDAIRVVRLCFHTGLTVTLQMEGVMVGFNLAAYHHPFKTLDLT
jgi:hypothetical protein